MTMPGVRIPPPSELEPLSDIPVDGDDLAIPGYGNIGTPGRPLGQEEIKGILQRELEDALGGLGSQVSEEQRQSIRMYYGRPLGNEIKDRSQVVSRDVFEVIEWTMPSLMRMFTGGMGIWEYSSRDSEGTDDAKNATAYINKLFMTEMNGFQVLYDWFKTGLLEKNGIIQVLYEETRKPKTQSYSGLTEDEVLALLSEHDAEPLAHEERIAVLDGAQIVLHDITIKTWEVRRRVIAEGVAPEEFLAARRMIVLDDDSPFTARRRKMSVSDLVALGFNFEEVANLPSDDTPEYSQGRTERLSEDETYPVTTAERTDAASRELWVTDCYIKLDEDGDGYAELRRILIVGEQSVVILLDDEINQNPFVSFTPVPMPHKFYGHSLADIVQDLQVIRSTILRQILDHIYLSVNPRQAIVEGMVEVDDMLTIRPGGLVRQRAPGQIEPLVLPPLPQEAMQAFDALKEIRSDRTGVMVHGRELDASAINSTATGLAQLMAEKQQKVELMARIAAQGVKELGRKILRLVVENATKEEQFEVNGEWITIDPRLWDANMDIDVRVGLGAGQAVERLNNLDKIAERQSAHIAAGSLGYTVTPENIHELDIAISEACGFRNDQLFFTDPSTREPPEPAPDPEMKKLEFEAIKEQSAQQAKMAEIELAAAKEQHLVAHRQAELEMKERVEMARIEANERAALGQQEATIEAARINAEGREDEGESNGVSE
jgi:hypothetical protein